MSPSEAPPQTAEMLRLARGSISQLPRYAGASRLDRKNLTHLVQVLRVKTARPEADRNQEHKWLMNPKIRKCLRQP